MKVVLDIEGDNLRDKCTTIHCVTLKGVDEKLSLTFVSLFPEDLQKHLPIGHNNVLHINELPKYINDSDTLIGHNIIGYDLPVLKRLLGIDFKGRKVDTLIWSKVLKPDRLLPKNCPTSLLNPYTGKKEKVGPHSLHAWGYRVGLGKPEHHDWKHISVGMIMRNIADTEINALVYQALCREAGIDC